MPTNFIWNGSRIQDRIEREFRKRVDEAARVVQARVDELISTASPARAAAPKAVGGRRGRHATAMGASRPGEPPYRRTGRLLNSIVVKSGGLSANVGATAPYATALERGTARMAARPFLQRALSDALPEIRRILAARLSS